MINGEPVSYFLLIIEKFKIVVSLISDNFLIKLHWLKLFGKTTI